ncbi:MAG: hypothetical protein ACI8ZN_001429 [Bacteroidia bacterium]|jgi:hypothetical protein
MKTIRFLTMLFQLGLIIAGTTAFFIPQGVALIAKVAPSLHPSLSGWLLEVNVSVIKIDEDHNFIWYGTDWMAFAHLLFALLFYGVWKNPVRNKWLVHFGIMACLLIFPTAFIAGHLRGIPFCGN